MINIDNELSSKNESVPRNAIWLTQEQAEKYNELAIKIIELEKEQEDILK